MSADQPLDILGDEAGQRYTLPPGGTADHGRAGGGRTVSLQGAREAWSVGDCKANPSVDVMRDIIVATPRACRLSRRQRERGKGPAPSAPMQSGPRTPEDAVINGLARASRLSCEPRNPGWLGWAAWIRRSGTQKLRFCAATRMLGPALPAKRSPQHRQSACLDEGPRGPVRRTCLAPILVCRAANRRSGRLTGGPDSTPCTPSPAALYCRRLHPG